MPRCRILLIAAVALGLLPITARSLASSGA